MRGFKHFPGRLQSPQTQPNKTKKSYISKLSFKDMKKNQYDLHIYSNPSIVQFYLKFEHTPDQKKPTYLKLCLFVSGGLLR